MPDHHTFKTQRLMLRPTAPEDAAFIFELLNTPKWLQFIGDRKVSSIEAAGEYIREKMLPQLERLGFSNYTVLRKEDGAKLGTCGLYDRQGVEGIDIGFAFLPEYEKKGYAFEACSELMRAAREDLGLTHINAITDKDNFASQKLVEKLGLGFTKTLRLPGEEKEVLFYEKSLEKEK
ncbi:GNAT family N-acetyltransferase [Antarcticibacterium arcticum]|uniref:GNAT family N-acetyltransferase n=1 Tax=Antarcticibacterium arcticum TaxID=2585771 RepID=A0A5B8YL39_9FLAO|nr:GNAT family N-acetyltransferase [Antarcticibacterium arcticum]QED37928.1 GNAT family N-acetyltransferase [Antarcticibacterium arcticum]